MMLSPISCNIEFKVWKICQTNSPGDSSPFHRYKIISKRICTTCVPQNPSLQGPAIGMKEFSVSSTTEVNRSLFTDENEQRSGPPSYSSLVSPPCRLSMVPDAVVKQRHSQYEEGGAAFLAWFTVSSVAFGALLSQMQTIHDKLLSTLMLNPQSQQTEEYSAMVSCLLFLLTDHHLWITFLRKTDEAGWKILNNRPAWTTCCC